MSVQVTLRLPETTITLLRSALLDRQEVHNSMAVASPNASLASQLTSEPEALHMATSSLTTSPLSKDDAILPGDFDIVKHYADLLQRDEVRLVNTVYAECF
jgi:hypothetical protein